MIDQRYYRPVTCIVYVLFVCLLFCAYLTVSPSWARGRMLIKPHIQTGWERESNFHHSETNEKTVDAWSVKPGIEFGYATEKSQVSLDYWFNWLTYDDQDEIDRPAGDRPADEFDYVEHQANLTTQVQASDRVIVGLDNLYWKTRDPANADKNSNAVDRFKYDMNRFSPWARYRFAEKFGVGVRYTNQMLNYSDDDPGQGEDSNENRGTLTLYYYFNQSTSFDLDYQVWNRDYEGGTSDYDSHQVMANVNRQFNYFTVSAGVGYHSRSFDSFVPNGDQEQVAWQVSVFGQNPPEAVDIPRSSMYVGLSSNLNDVGTGEAYYNMTRLDAVFSYLLWEKLNSTLTFWFSNADYETSSREDDHWYISGAFDYLINEYFSAGIEAGAEERDSNLTGRSYDNEFVMLNVTFNYDLGSRD